MVRLTWQVFIKIVGLGREVAQWADNALCMRETQVQSPTLLDSLLSTAGCDFSI